MKKISLKQYKADEKAKASTKQGSAKKRPWDYVQDLSINKMELVGEENELSGYSSMLINRLLSMNKMYLPIVAILNKSTLDAVDHYNFWLNFLPKTPVQVGYIKKKGEDADAEDLKLICSHFKLGTADAQELIDNTDSELLRQFLEKARIV
jgi:hypothetical protein